MRSLRLAKSVLPLASWTMNCAAQPAAGALADPVRLAAEGIGYTHRAVDLSSVDGERLYRLEIFRPRSPVPPAGYPVLFLLDGNAAAERMVAELTACPFAGPAPVVVAIAYRSGLRFDLDSWSYDYTPRVDGRADVFFDFNEQRIKPAPGAEVAIDPARQLTDLLIRQGVSVRYQEFPGGSHGQAFGKAIRPTIEWFGECAGGMPGGADGKGGSEHARAN